jgi:hypothetical protein
MKYDLVGIDGNAFAIIGYTSRAMKETGFTYDEIADYKRSAMKSDYDNLLYVSAQKIDEANERAKAAGYNDDEEDEDEVN